MTLCYLIYSLRFTKIKLNSNVITSLNLEMEIDFFFQLRLHASTVYMAYYI